MNLQVKKTVLVARYTFLEIIKSKVLMNTFILGAALMIVSFVASEFTFGVPQKISLDIGVGLLSISAVAMAIFFGSSLMTKEIESRTVFMLLSRPIKRNSFLIGRLLGLILMIILNTFILGVLTLGVYFFLGGSPDALIFWCLGLIVLEAIMMLVIVVFFSLITNTTMAVLYSITTYIIGHILSASLSLEFVKNSPITQKVIGYYGIFFPDFSKLNIKDFLIYNVTLPNEILFKASTYGVLYSVGVLILCLAVFNNRDLE